MKKKKKKPIPLETAASEIKDIIGVLLENREALYSKKISKEMEKHLENLEINVAVFKESVERTLKDAEISEQEIEEEISKPSEKLSKREKQSMEEAVQLKGELEAMRQQNEQIKQALKKEKKQGKAARMK